MLPTSFHDLLDLESLHEYPTDETPEPSPHDRHQTPSPHPSRQAGGSAGLRTLSTAAMALLLGIAVTAAVTARAPAQSPAGQAATAHAVRLISPAVVRIVIAEAAQVICTGCASDGSNVTFPANGGSYYQASSGSGVLVSPDGYIVTADHVIDGTSADASDFLTDAAKDYAQMAGISVTDAQNTLQALQQAGRLQIPIQVVSRVVFLSTPFLGPLPTSAHAARPTLAYNVTQVVARSPMTEHDVAIVKIAAHDLPYATLAPAGATRVQEPVTAVAFPAEADVGAGLYDSADYSGLFNPAQATATQLDNLLTPTVEDGQIVAEKVLADGTPIYETTSIGNHGSSGGPVVDTQGRVVGFVDRLASSDASATGSDMLIVVPSSVIAPYLKQAGVGGGTRGAGSLMAQWRAALAAYDADGLCHWTAARDALARLHARYPQFGGEQAYLAQARAQTASTLCGKIAGATAGIIAGYPGGLGGLINFLVFGALIGLVLARQPRLQTALRARRQSHAAAEASAQVWARQVPLWSLALQCLGAGALTGVITSAVTALIRVPAPGRLAFPADLISGLTAGLVICLLVRVMERGTTHDPTTLQSPPETERAENSTTQDTRLG